MTDPKNSGLVQVDPNGLTLPICNVCKAPVIQDPNRPLIAFHRTEEGHCSISHPKCSLPVCCVCEQPIRDGAFGKDKDGIWWLVCSGCFKGLPAQVLIIPGEENTLPHLPIG